MAGYIFTIDDINSIEESIYDGVYGTVIKNPENKYWHTHHEGTFADYITMQEGDNVYFLHQRKIYGIGELININGDCKFLNFPDSDLPYIFIFNDIKEDMIINRSEKDVNKRMVCIFKGSPHFFKNGVDMDEVLSSNPAKFKMLRAFWRLSFIKIDDEENKALMDVILKNNEENLLERRNIYEENRNVHERIRHLLEAKGVGNYKVNADKILSEAYGSEGKIKHEMALEAGILDYISNKKGDVFGDWDYVSHQVVASPFKPVDYMDKMDIFGYRYIPGFQTISKYLVIEIKKGVAQMDDLKQVMKYVDWVNHEYGFGNYNMIEAFLVAYDFSDEVKEQKNKIAVRNYVKGTRPVVSMEWDNLKLVKYRFNPEKNRLEFWKIN